MSSKTGPYVVKVLARCQVVTITCTNADLMLWNIREAFQNAYELLNQRSIKIQILYKNCIFPCMDEIFCVEFQRYPLKFHTNYLTHTLKDLYIIQIWKFKRSWIWELVSIFLNTPWTSKTQLEQVACLHSEDTPAASWLPIPLSHIGSQVKRRQSQSYKFKELAKISSFWILKEHYTRHTFWSCLIRCANMKWIWWVLFKVQSGHNSVHRRTNGQIDGRTDGQTDRWTRWNQYTPLSTSLKRGV